MGHHESIAGALRLWRKYQKEARALFDRAFGIDPVSREGRELTHQQRERSRRVREHYRRATRSRTHERRSRT